MPLRIAHLLPNMAIGGRERLTNLLCREGERRGCAPLLIGYDPLPPDSAGLRATAAYVQLDRKAAGFAARMRELLVERKVDVVHAQGHIPAWYLAQAQRGWDGKLPALATMHIGLEGSRRWLWQIRSGLRTMDRLTAVSMPLARSYRLLAGRAVSHIANGIELAPFAATEWQPAGNAPFRFAMLSRLDAGKRHIDAIRAAEKLVAEGLNVELHIAGDGDQRPMLERLASERPWLFLAGAVEPSEFLGGKQGFLLPSRREAMPMALAEAMAAGLPSIASDLPSLRDMGGDGLLHCDAGSVRCLAERMRSLVVDEALCRRLSLAARQRAAAFDIARIFDEYLAIYEELADGGG